MSNKKKWTLQELENLIKENLTPEERFKFHTEQQSLVCKEQEWGDPTSYARNREIYAAIELGHEVSKTFSGADAYNQNGDPVEYKSTIQTRMSMSYTGISAQKDWSSQVKYLKEKKILPYPEHYANRFDSGRLVESWMLPGQVVYDLLLPKLKKSFGRHLGYKDPRLSASLSQKQIKLYGNRVI